MQQRFWFFPAIDLGSYIRKYPFVFTFSLLSALSGVVEMVLHVLLNQREDIAISGFTVLVKCFQLGIPLFGLVRLLLDSTWLGRAKSAAVWHCLGLALLFGCFEYFTNDEALDDSLQYTQLFGLLTLALLALPLLKRLDSAPKQWAYLTDLILCAASAYLAFSLLSFLIDFIYTRFPATFMNYFLVERWAGNITFSQSLVFFLVVPWYLMGVLEKNMDPEKQAEPAGATIGKSLAYGMIASVLVFFLWAVLMVTKSVFTQDPVSSDYVNYFLACCSLGFASLVFLWPLKAQEPEGWMDDYRKIVALVSLVLLAFCIYLLFHDGKEWESVGSSWDILSAGYPEFLFSLWLFGAMLYYLLLKEASWGKPALGLVALLALTLVGPLSPREVSFHCHRQKLEKLLRTAGMFKDGYVQKPPTSLERQPYSDIQQELYMIATYSGLSRLQPWFKLDLRPFSDLGESERQSGGSLVATRLMDAVGAQMCDTLGSTDVTRSYGPKYYEQPLNIVGYSQEQRINFGPGCPVIMPGVNDRVFVTGLSNQNRTLTVQFGNEYLADVPLEKVSQVLKANDYNEIIRRKIPQEELSVEYENPKVRVKVYFQNLQAVKVGEDIRITAGGGVLLVQRK